MKFTAPKQKLNYDFKKPSKYNIAVPRQLAKLLSMLMISGLTFTACDKEELPDPAPVTYQFAVSSYDQITNIQQIQKDAKNPLVTVIYFEVIENPNDPLQYEGIYLKNPINTVIRPAFQAGGEKSRGKGTFKRVKHSTTKEKDTMEDDGTMVTPIEWLKARGYDIEYLPGRGPNDPIVQLTNSSKQAVK